jgi:hypothetical protein
VRHEAFKGYNHAIEKCEKPTSIPRSSVCVRTVSFLACSICGWRFQNLWWKQITTLSAKQIYPRTSNSALLLYKSSYIKTIFAVSRFKMGVWGYHGRYSDLASGWTTDGRVGGVPVPVESRIFTSPCRPASYPLGTGGSFPGERQGRDAHHSRPTSGEDPYIHFHIRLHGVLLN